MKLKDLFNIEYPKTLIFSEQSFKEDGVNFVSSSAIHNGVVGKVSENDNIKKYLPGVITVPLKGSVLHAFVQPEECYVAHQIAVLTPKIKMSDKEKIFYCLLIRKNKFKYNFGRQADKTLSDLEVPSKVPKWVNETSSSIIPKIDSLNNSKKVLDTKHWKSFRYDEIFDIEKGYYNKKPPAEEDGKIPFIGATEYSNGITSYHNRGDIDNYDREGKKDFCETGRIFKSNCITVSNNGSVGYAFYQPIDFTCSHDINPLRLRKTKMNLFLALFLCTIIGLERYRWNYGRKWRPTRMPYSIIKLPIDKEGNPDWQFMEDYIKSLPYSSNL